MKCEESAQYITVCTVHSGISLIQNIGRPLLMINYLWCSLIRIYKCFMSISNLNSLWSQACWISEVPLHSPDQNLTIENSEQMQHRTIVALE